MTTKKLLWLFLILTISATSLKAEKAVYIYFDQQSSKTQFAVDEINSALKEKQQEVNTRELTDLSLDNTESYKLVLLNMSDKAHAKWLKKSGIKTAGELKSEGFIISRKGDQSNTIWIAGADAAGVMYGGLEAAEIIQIKGIAALDDQLQNPYMKVRGTKFNIPLDVRTPTYTEPCDAAQNNMEEMWNFEFWKDYIDNLARYRYNTISLWSMHPFPSMIKVPEYPDIALDDVRKSTVEWEENYPLNGWDFDAPEIVNNYEVIKKMTIEEKIEFWRQVMAYGKSRNVQFFVLTWNIFVYGTEGKYGITDKLENPITTDYFRKSVEQMVLTYPDLAGIGLTTGENMYDYNTTQKEEWAFATYGQGVLDAIEKQPGRKINLIHRQHQTQAKQISNIFKDVFDHEDINFIFSFKYAKAHVYSSTTQVYHHDFVEDIKRVGVQTLWTLRNDDIFQFRWGAPDYVREFIQNIPYDVSEGYYYGSDQYVWGREFIGKNSSEPRDIEVVKHWYQWMCWGRLGYNPEMSNDRFIDYIQYRFPEVKGREMFEAWQNASMIYPWVTGFHWGALDFQWYIESGQSQPFVANTPSGYHDVNRFITLKPHKGTGYISVPDYTKAYLNNSEMEGETPLEVADKIIKSADAALDWTFEQGGDIDGELRLTIDDIKTIAWLGKNYAHKIKAATYLSLFRESLDREWYSKVIDELNLSAAYWRHFSAAALANYKNPLWTNRVGYVDWKENFDWAVYDITANGGWPDLPSMKPTPGGTILEAEDAKFEVCVPETETEGFTGTGYLTTPRAGDAKHRITWTYNAPEAGNYILEFRYSMRRHDEYPSPLVINGSSVDEMQFWSTGNTGCWVWKREFVNLKKGENTIFIAPEGWVLFDHLNVIKN